MFDFGERHRNTICWSPSGRFVCLAGFGNLAGDMDFWDRNKLKLMGSNNALGVNFGWSACGRFFMTATTAPRMNVDNNVKVFKYNGNGPLASLAFPGKLWHAAFAPAAPGAFPDRPQSPPPKGAEAKAAAAAAAAAAPEQPKKVAAYRPPRGSGSLSAMMRAEREPASDGARINIGARMAAVKEARDQKMGLSDPVADAKAAKNKAAKDRKKKAKEAAAEAAAAEAKLKADAEAAAAAARAEDPVKQAKKLNKKLKQIDALIAKRAGGAELNADQKAKLEEEAGLRAELAKLSL